MMYNISTMDDRSQALLSLGFSSYREYLYSDLWAKIRTAVLHRAKFRCSCCDDKATQVHHSSYDLDTLAGRRLIQLTALCRTCHAAAEFEASRKCDLAAANNRLGKFASATPAQSRQKRNDAAMIERRQADDVNRRRDEHLNYKHHPSIRAAGFSGPPRAKP